MLRDDRQFVWHPYAPSQAPAPLYEVVAAEGVTLHLRDGRSLVDGMSNWWAAIHGHNPAPLRQALVQQVSSLPHVMFGGLTHAPAVELGRLLARLAPVPLQRSFFCDSGSVAVEVAVKMAWQAWQGRGRSEKRQVLALRGGYHGDTLGAMALCDPDNGLHRSFAGLLPVRVFAPRPVARFDEPLQAEEVDRLTALFAEHHAQLAAFILEPIVQGAGGMHVYSPHYLRLARQLCDEHQVLLIADEIATGFGRTGRLFACEHAGISPDILCLGKALTGGMLSGAAVMVTEEVASAIDASPAAALMHGPTFTANPMVCAVARASIELLLETPWQARVQAIERQLREELAPCRHLPAVADVRVLGAIGVVEMRAPLHLAQATELAVAKGVWLRPFGRLLYTMPPLNIGAHDLGRVAEAMRTIAAAV